jgi:hypothetical protein
MPCELRTEDEIWRELWLRNPVTAEIRMLEEGLHLYINNHTIITVTGIVPGAQSGR